MESKVIRSLKPLRALRLLRMEPCVELGGVPIGTIRIKPNIPRKSQ